MQALKETEVSKVSLVHEIVISEIGVGEELEIAEGVHECSATPFFHCFLG